MNPILPEQYAIEKQFNSRVDNFFTKYKIGQALRHSNFQKTKGFSCLELFRFIFALVFNGKNLHRTLQSEVQPGRPEKDTVYRFLNSCRYNWRKFLLILSSAAIKETIEPLSSRNRKNVLIFDDSLYSRSPWVSHAHPGLVGRQYLSAGCLFPAQLRKREQPDLWSQPAGR